mmetsp:Transcript_6335/g.15688  ORF Transcript_6335/g.15688 Transcript_6335/m.15688 type:complete len:300 (-) Transcript_6335:1139-2038(-)|eukprot:CAMPEP_0178998390 /NCGR_PEP_ID=MMETSP0795-20121207/9487_1 /TAXON_ID=88552 /ORGANISM="Amoebophrya sp., Strain Ameob2" /LENGTH=299 /DNA_ID=CAMNT_0020691065 /DNA_START=284 /DNA_END=1183 /DNA_ORIENTATION=-
MSGQKKSGALATLAPVTAGAATVAVTMYPVDVCRALVMSNPGVGAGEAISGFLKTHGVAGFAKQGMVAELTRGTFSRLVKFWVQPIAHENVFGMKQKDGNPLTKGLAGMLATVPEVVIISPIENIKLAEQLDKEKKFNGMGSVASHLYKTRGTAGLYIGYAGMQMRQALWTGGFFASCDVFAGAAQGVFGKGLLSDVCGGFGAGMFGVALNCWCDVTRTIIQKDAIAATFDPKGAVTTWGDNLSVPAFVGKAGQIASERGFMSGLYAGVHVKAVHLGGSGALLAVLMPRFKTWFGVESS